MLLTDGVHLVSDFCLEELHFFAQQIGLKREWFQDHPRHPHYDLTSKQMKWRVRFMLGVTVSSKELVRRCFRSRWNVEKAKEESDD